MCSGHMEPQYAFSVVMRETVLRVHTLDAPCTAYISEIVIRESSHRNLCNIIVYVHTNVMMVPVVL